MRIGRRMSTIAHGAAGADAAAAAAAGAHGRDH
jgi:hypothetical protein